MHRRHNALIGLRTGDRQHIGVFLADDLRLGAEAASDDDAAVFRKGGTDGVERLVARRIEEAARIDDDEVGAVMLAGDLVAFGAEPRDDALGIDERLRATKTYETDAWGRHKIFQAFRDRRRNITLIAALVWAGPSCGKTHCEGPAHRPAEARVGRRYQLTALLTCGQTSIAPV